MEGGGARIAPRYFGTGEAIDGARIFYNFMRPTFDEQQLALELERAAALDYDLMKSYVRLSPEWLRTVIAWAHSRRIPATSHYHYPALAFGGDGMEHVGATSRFGYSRTVTALGSGYRDVIDIFDASGAVRAPTLFGSVTLFRRTPRWSTTGGSGRSTRPGSTRPYRRRWRRPRRPTRPWCGRTSRGRSRSSPRCCGAAAGSSPAPTLPSRTPP
jgi:hypothetical protein